MGISREDFDRIRNAVPRFAYVPRDLADSLYEGYQVIERSLPIGAEDFFRYRLFDRTLDEAANYLTRSSYAMLCGRVNDPITASGLVNKAAFYDEYQDYLGREYVVCHENERERFIELCEHNRRLVYKPRTGTYGVWASMVSSRESLYLWRDALIEEAIIEERIVQHAELTRLFPYAVNTVRFLTVMGSDGDPNILAVALRCGHGRYVIDGGGSVVAGVDVDSGTIYTDASTRRCEQFEVHPDTGVAFKGFVLPEWDVLLERALDVARLHPDLRLMNWDWACREDGMWCLFEGNFSGGIGTLQEAVDSGLKSQINEALGIS